MIDQPKSKVGKGVIIVAALSGDYGKPRPALVVQSEQLSDLHSVVICPITSTIRDNIRHLRVTIEPGAENGIKFSSQIMLDKITSISTTRIGGVIGRADDETMRRVTQGLFVLLALT